MHRRSSYLLSCQHLTQINSKQKNNDVIPFHNDTYCYHIKWHYSVRVHFLLRCLLSSSYQRKPVLQLVHTCGFLSVCLIKCFCKLRQSSVVYVQQSQLQTIPLCFLTCLLSSFSTLNLLPQLPYIHWKCVYSLSFVHTD